LHESIAVAFERRRDSRDVSCIEPQADNVRH
jgi:hypothetical protein